MQFRNWVGTKLGTANVKTRILKVIKLNTADRP